MIIKDSQGLLDVSEAIKKLKEENIKFNIVSEKEAKAYLTNNNDYDNLLAYASNFPKININGVLINKYADLEFAYLKDLAIIDYEFRRLIFRMTTDIEHYLKVKILRIAETIKEEDGYKIVNMYLEKDYNDTKKLHNSILNKTGNRDINEKIEDIPIRKFMNIISFGELISFYEFFLKAYKLNLDMDDIFILRDIVKLRNSACHNNLILNDLKVKDNKNRPPYKIIQYLNSANIEVRTRNKKLSNSRIRRITYTVYMFNEIVTSEDVKDVVKEEIKKFFFGRVVAHKEYYKNNELLKSTYSYFEKIIKQYY